ncbi:MAG: CCA tRNA nucleotidyltransferase [Candidatus Thermoplasmatota archaeon]|nr:CCA tRNA nucleotidyltransferase [Candidatus Thermoplasmatota archaeon]
MAIKLREHILGNEADINGLPLTENMMNFVNSLSPEISEVLDKISSSGGGVWIVGGAVRDAAMGLSPSDIDLATDLRPEKLLEIFPTAIETGVAFGTITVKTKSFLVQTTTLRTDGEYHDGRRPDSVEWKLSLNEDLKRRDFTINSMAIDVARRTYYDPNNGMDDLGNTTIRCVGNPVKRINEDALRILRAYRFQGQFEVMDWKLEGNLSIAIRDYSFLIDDLSKERVWQELSKILASKKAHEILINMLEDGVLNIVFNWGKRSNNKLTSALKLNFQIDAAATFVLLNYQLNLPDLKNMCKRLKLSNAEIKNILHSSKIARKIPETNPGYLRLYRYLAGDRWEQIIRLARIFCQFNMESSFASIEPDYFASIEISLHKLPTLTHDQQLVDGNWIMSNTGLTQGEKLGRLKQWLFRLQVEYDLQNVSDISAQLAKIQWQNSDFTLWPKLALD